VGAAGEAAPSSAQPAESTVLSEYHKWYYANHTRTWQNTSWMGTPTWKLPLDMWIYQELLHEVRPDVIVECGTWRGGSALFFSHMFDLMGKGRVITIDIVVVHGQPKHPRITYLVGSSTSPEIVQKVKSLVKPGEKVMVVLDSDHTKPHVQKECELYSPMVSKGSYLVVEDTNVNGHPVAADFGPGPMEGMQAFLATNKQFQIDKSREKFGVTFNPSGYLKRIA